MAIATTDAYDRWSHLLGEPRWSVVFVMRDGAAEPQSYDEPSERHAQASAGALLPPDRFDPALDANPLDLIAHIEIRAGQFEQRTVPGTRTRDAVWVDADTPPLIGSPSRATGTIEWWPQGGAVTERQPSLFQGAA